jgi:hypothetical protein
MSEQISAYGRGREAFKAFPALKRCRDPLCRPVEQIRGEMGPGDYKDVEVSNGPNFNAPPHKTIEHYKHVEISEFNRNDFRICCLHCGKVTGWAMKDFPNMPDAGADYVRKQWAKSVE